MNLPSNEDVESLRRKIDDLERLLSRIESKLEKVPEQSRAPKPGPPVRRIAFVNEKGGTCKTTLAVNTAAWLAQARKLRVLLVDLDTQGHAGKSLGPRCPGAPAPTSSTCSPTPR